MESRRIVAVATVLATTAWVACHAQTASLAITGVQLVAPGRLKVTYPSSPDAYFILDGGGEIRDLRQPSALALGRAGPDSLQDEGNHGSTRFLRLRRVPLTSPLDLDGDGIDDVFELQHALALDPLDPADAAQDFDGDGVSNLDEYRAGTDPGGGVITGATVYVVDSPPAGSTVHFRELTEAVAALGASLPPAGTGRVIVATDRPQVVARLELDAGIALEPGEGYAGRVVIEGPGTTPLSIRTSGPFNLSGFAIRNAGGLQLGAGRGLRLQGSRFPATSIAIGAAASQIAPASPGPRARHDGGASSVTVGDCAFSGPLNLAWFGDIGASADLAITQNSAPVIHASVHGTFGGSARISGNLAQDLSLSFDALAAAQVQVSELANLERLSLTGNATGNPRFQVANVVAGTVSLNFLGMGSVYASMNALTAREMTIDAGAAASEFEAAGITAESLVWTLRKPSTGTPRASIRQRDATVRAGVRIEAWDAEHGQLDLDLAVLSTSTLELRTRANTRLQLSDQVSLSGQLKATVEADLLELHSVGARLESGIEISGSGVGAGVYGYFQGGNVQGKASFQGDYGVFMGVTVDATVFDPGGALSITRGGSEDTHRLHGPPSARLQGRLPSPMAAGDKPILLRNLQQAPGSVLIAEVDSPVTLENCTFNGSGMLPVVVLEEVGGAIQVRQCRFSGQGIGISESTGDVLIADSTFEATDAMVPVIGIRAASATITETTVSGSGMTGLALHLTGAAVVENLNLGEGFGLEIGAGNVQLEGGRIGGIAAFTGGRTRVKDTGFSSVLMIVGEGLLGFDSAALAGVTIADFNEHGGLLNDPTGYGALPGDVYSSIDFDNDSKHCADYPPPQVRPDTGECVRPGVPPPQ